jgi:CheY-like chemotaxis protein
MAIRVLAVDDHNIVRRMTCALLQAESDIKIIAEATTAAEAIAMAEKHRPDVILLDLSLPDMNGLAVAKLLREIVPSARILILSERRRCRLLAKIGLPSRTGNGGPQGELRSGIPQPQTFKNQRHVIHLFLNHFRISDFIFLS